MKEVQLIFRRSHALEEVSLSTAYAGAKRQDEPKTYERVATTEANADILGRFWVEAMGDVSDAVKRYCRGRQQTDDQHTYTLYMPEAWDATLQSGLQTAFDTYVVNYIIAKWCGYTERDDTELYAHRAADGMFSATRKLYFRQRPTRQ